MCGIAGIYRPGGSPVPRELIRTMMNAMIHRGPDADGIFCDGNIGLGHKRLSILDLTLAGNQPMSTSDGKLIVVFNGEIYNFQNLKFLLQERGHKFFSKSDTEVLLHAYREWGVSFVEKLNGMFAFAIWDLLERKLILARDRYGQKPLYIWRNGEEIVFASEIKAVIKHPGFSTSVNFHALNEYFTFQNLFRSHTLFKNVELLSPATIFIANQLGDVKTYTYWDYNFTDQVSNMKEQEAEDETLRLFKQAVSRQMIADVRVGSYLSGGMDSGSITSVAAKEVQRLATFTCGFDMSTTTGREANFDERRDAELMSSFFKTEHYEQVINAGDLTWSMPRVVWHIEDLRLGMSYPNYYISRLASRFVKVCLSGAGGDELYGGYPWRYYRVFRSVDKSEYLKEYYNFWQRLVNEENKKNLFSLDIQKTLGDSENMFEVFSSVFSTNSNLRYDSPEDHVANSLYFEAKTFLHSLFLVGDKLSMANSLEERFPFMDNDLVDFAMKIPVRYKLGKLDDMMKIDENETKKLHKFAMQFDDGKNILRKAMRTMIPEPIINRKKQGFSAPDESWYRGENLQYVKEILLDKRASYRDFINQNFVEKIIEEHVEKHINHRLLIWSFLSLEWWCKIFLDGYRVEE